MTTPEMIPVDSSNIEAIGYDQDDRTLYVHFMISGTYMYLDVPAEVYEEFVQADSKGSYLNREIRHNYDYQKL